MLDLTEVDKAQPKLFFKFHILNKLSGFIKALFCLFGELAMILSVMILMLELGQWSHQNYSVLIFSGIFKTTLLMLIV